MFLGTPLFLIAMAALLVPIMIHLWSKNTKNQVFFGSTRFLQETVTKTTRQFFPSDLLLLLLRCLILAVLVLILTEPYLLKEKATNTAFLIDPVLYEDLESIKNSLPEDAVIFWLSETKTPVEDSLMDLRRNLWLNYDVFAEYDSLVIFSPRYLTEFHGKRPEAAQKVKWIIPPARETEQKLTVIQKGETAYEVVVSSNENRTISELQETASAGAVPSVTVFIHSIEKHKALEKLIRAALQAIDKNGLISLNIKTFNEEEMTGDQWLIWLDDQPAEWRKNLLYVRQNQQEVIRQVSAGIYTIDGEADTDNMLRQNFPLQLESLLHEMIITQLEVKDRRVLPEPQLQAAFVEKETVSLAEIKVSFAWIGWIIFLLLILTERILSGMKARQ